MQISNTSFQDPRLSPDFDEDAMPLIEGGSLPRIGTEDRHEKLVIEFSAIYYEMNRALARVEQARSAGDAEAERLALDSLCTISRMRDELEDRCAPEGFYAEPAMDGERYADLHFMWAGKPTLQIREHKFSAKFSFER
jgi:hypothetical protein